MDEYTDPVRICLVGMGPRGLSVLERLCANARREPGGPPLTVVVADPAAPGAGSVWRSDQSPYLLTNTVASQISLYTDDSSQIEGPIEPGPSLHEWSRALVGPDEEDPAIRAEAERLGPDDYPTRAFYGRYLRAAFERIVDRAPSRVTVQVYRCRADALSDTHGVPGGPQGVKLEDGTRLHDLDAVVLALGHLPTRLTAREARTGTLARIHRLTYVTPANPADLNLADVEPGEPVLLRGLGLNFFDHMALFTIGRGGRFERGPDGELVYRGSGREPVMYASSRRGVPFHARGDNQKGVEGRHTPRFLTPQRIADLHRRVRGTGSAVSFRDDLWPLIAREVEFVYYATLLGHRADFEGDCVAHDPRAPLDPLLDRYGVGPGVRWDWERLANPCRGETFTDREDFTRWLVDRLRRDVADARAGNVHGPLKAGLDVLRDLRNEIRLVVDHGGLDGGSHRDDLDGWYTPLNAYLSIGPPAERIEQMVALLRAGILHLTGPGTRIRLDVAGRAFEALSDRVPGPPVRSRVLIEARLPEPDLRRTRDPLLTYLLDTNQAAPFRIATADGTFHETGGLAVTERPYRMIDGRGAAHPRRFAFGVPTESVHWVTAAGIRPGVDSVTLADSDAIARAVLALPPVFRVPEALRRDSEQDPYPGELLV